jgi:hypothetical protein
MGERACSGRGALVNPWFRPLTLAAVLGAPFSFAEPAHDAARVTSLLRAGTPVRESVDRAVGHVIETHLRPCDRAGRENVPCFPVLVEEQGPRYSVAQSLRDYRPDGSPAPDLNPTVADVQSHLSGALQSASGGVGLDPVCAAKGLWKKLKGTGGPYYLYRTWDRLGERPLLSDHELAPDDYDSYPEFRFVLLGKYGGECEAVSAWRKALREATAREDEGPPP